MPRLKYKSTANCNPALGPLSTACQKLRVITTCSLLWALLLLPQEHITVAYSFCLCAHMGNVKAWVLLMPPGTNRPVFAPNWLCRLHGVPGSCSVFIARALTPKSSPQPRNIFIAKRFLYNLLSYCHHLMGSQTLHKLHFQNQFLYIPLLTSDTLIIVVFLLLVAQSVNPKSPQTHSPSWFTIMLQNDCAQHQAHNCQH